MPKTAANKCHEHILRFFHKNHLIIVLAIIFMVVCSVVWLLLKNLDRKNYKEVFVSVYDVQKNYKKAKDTIINTGSSLEYSLLGVPPIKDKSVEIFKSYNESVERLEKLNISHDQDISNQYNMFINKNEQFKIYINNLSKSIDSINNISKECKKSNSVLDTEMNPDKIAPSYADMTSSCIGAWNNLQNSKIQSLSRLANNISKLMLNNRKNLDELQDASIKGRQTKILSIVEEIRKNNREMVIVAGRFSEDIKEELRAIDLEDDLKNLNDFTTKRILTSD
ncbi:MAG: hypothetical protein ACFNUR_01045 [Candidatus Saccharibacteria bacterium]